MENQPNPIHRAAAAPPPEPSSFHSEAPTAAEILNQRRSRNPWKFVAIGAGALLAVVIGVGVWWWWSNRMPGPVVLSEPEKRVLESKLEAVSGEPIIVDGSHIERPPELVMATVGEAEPGPAQDALAGVTDPELRRDLMSDEDRRTVVFTEREINGFINHNTGLADQFYLHFANDAMVAKMAYTFHDDVPVLGGQEVKLRCALGARLDENTGELYVALQDVTVNGVPIPNAWLGDIKNRNLIEAASGSEPSGFLKAFADGIEDISLENGQIRIRLAP